MRRVLALVPIAALALIAVPTPATAGVRGLDVSLASPSEPLTFDLAIVNVGCNPGTFQVLAVEANGVGVTPISVTEDAGDPNKATMVLPSDTPAGTLDVTAQCDESMEPIEVEGTESWAALAVTKVVTGPAPADATFTVHVDCTGLADRASMSVQPDELPVASADLPDDFAVDLGYTAAGGVHYVYTDHHVSCALTEPEDGGAASVTIDPGTVEMPEPGDFAATVTNTFVPAPIVVTPTFTG